MKRFKHHVHPLEGPWKPYQGTYPDPTPKEFHYIQDFLETFDFEKDDFAEIESWKELGKELGFPNLRLKLVELLDQIRGSKGYDVEHDFSFFAPFDPCIAFKDEKHIRRSKMAAEVAIATINSQMMPTGKSYELVKLEKCVWTFQRHSYLMTLTVKEVGPEPGPGPEPEPEPEVDAPTLKTIRAMVFAQPIGPTELTEWKFIS